MRSKKRQRRLFYNDKRINSARGNNNFHIYSQYQNTQIYKASIDRLKWGIDLRVIILTRGLSYKQRLNK
jgi:hypothetical protein